VLPGKQYTPEAILKILWHRRWLLIVPMAAASIGAYTVARRLPSIYSSETVIQVVPQRIPESYVRSTVTTRIEDRLGGIRQIILSRSRLERIILDFDLYQDERKVMVIEDVVALMRNRDVDVRVERGDAFRVSYVNLDPRLAQKVAEKLGSLFIDENLRDREALAEQTSQFLEGQLEDAKRRLLEKEKKLEEYRRRYSGELPTQLQANLQAIQNVHLQLQGLTEAVNRDRERRLLLERQLADLQAGDIAPVSAPQASPTTTTDPTATGTTAEQLEAAIALRRTLLVRFTPDHPDVATMNRRIRDIEAKLQVEMANRPATAADVPKPVTAAEILRQNRSRDLKANLEAVDREIAAKQANDSRLRAVVAEYQAKVDAVPSRESDLTELTRDYTTLQSIYTDLLNKREASKLSANVERQQIGEQFKILDPARVPERPFSPNRPLIVAIGSFLGLGAGLMLIGLLEYRDTTFKTEEDVRLVLGLPVLALVPMMASESEVRARRRRKITTGFAILVVLVSSAAALAVWKLQLGF
jgi:polysaccharide chain length determinant protein (PEP-CTERM system associated)